MPFIRKGSFTVHYMDEDREENFSSGSSLVNEIAAHAAAAHYVGNHSRARVFPHEKTYLYGPGDGTTSVMVREDIEWVPKEDPK